MFNLKVKMKKIILISFLTFSFSFLFSQQEGSPCNPDPTLQDSVYVIIPDCTIGDNLPQAYSGQNYTAVIQIKTPEKVGDVIDSAFVDLGLPTGPVDVSNVVVDSISIVSVTGLPTGISYECSSSNCSFPGDAVGCVAVGGVTSDVGVHPINISINGYISFFGSVYDLYGTLGDYQYIDCFIIDVTSSANIIDNKDFKHNYPNPFDSKTLINYTSNISKRDVFNVYNLTGKLVFSDFIYSVKGVNSFEFDGSFLKSGVYYYSVEDNFENRMMIKK